jgi:hypothetical protein
VAPNVPFDTEVTVTVPVGTEPPPAVSELVTVAVQCSRMPTIWVDGEQTRLVDVI